MATYQQGKFEQVNIFYPFWRGHPFYFE